MATIECGRSRPFEIRLVHDVLVTHAGYSMSIRIQNETVSSADAAKHAEQLRGISGNAAGRAGNSNAIGLDSVDLSAGTTSITSALATADSARADRVQALRAAHENGQYQVDAAQVSRSLIAGAIQFSSVNRS